MTHDAVLKALCQISATRPRKGRGHTQKAETAFAAEGLLPLDALAVSVSGIGALAQGLSHDQALALHAISQPAPYGLRERTLVDARVRHAGENPAECVELRWSGDSLTRLSIIRAEKAET